MNVGAAIEWVEDHIDYGGWAARSGRTGHVELSLDRMRRLMNIVGDPQRATPVIHVSGTNGKGSTSRMITRLLMEEGLRVGTYSSPHLAAYNERFRIDDTDITDAELTVALSTMRVAEDALGDRLMPFEILTGAAFWWFAHQRVDVAVIEVGVLGRFDATNVADGRVAVITNIGFDHTDGTGDWEQRIAWEKAGIVKPGSHLILGPLDPRLEPTFAAESPARTWRFGREIVLNGDGATGTGRMVAIETPWQRLDEVALALHGAHQAVNAAQAVAAASAFVGRALDQDRVARAFGAVRMPARLEVLPSSVDTTFPTVILDGAHNPEAAAALAAALREMPCTGRRRLIIGLLAGRDPATMLEAVDAASFDEVVACTPPTARALPAATLVAAASQIGCIARPIDDIVEALQQLRATAAAGDQIVVTGSIYLVADARRWLMVSD